VKLARPLATTAALFAALALTACDASTSSQPTDSTSPSTSTPAAPTEATTAAPTETATTEGTDAAFEGGTDAGLDGTADPMHVGSIQSEGDFFFFNDEGALGKFTLPTEPSADVKLLLDRLIPDYDPLVTKVTVDNRKGSTSYDVNDITGFDDAGKTYEFTELGSTLAEPQWDYYESLDIFNDAEQAAYEEVEQIIYAMDSTVEAGAIEDVWLILPEGKLPKQFTRLGINGGSQYFGGSEAIPAEQASDWNADLSFKSPNN
jgi:hypothetical protein